MKAQVAEETSSYEMEDLTDVTIGPCPKSQYISPVRIEYKQAGTKQHRDAVRCGAGVLILIYNRTRDVLVFVKQFRPAVYASRIESIDPQTTTCIDHTRYPACRGVTFELCAGLVDKAKTLAEIAQDELLEECGYKVPLENIRKITEYRSEPVLAGALHTLYYAEVTDAMRVGPGGGNPDEGEFIEVVEVPAVNAYDVIMDENKHKTISEAFAVLWFYRNVYTDEFKANVKRCVTSAHSN